MPRNPAPTKQKKKPEPVQVIEPPNEPTPPVQVIERRIETVVVEIPLGEPPHRINDFHLDVLLKGDHAHAAARLRQALRDKHAKTVDGRLVETRPDVFRWLLEQFAA